MVSGRMYMECSARCRGLQFASKIKILLIATMLGCVCFLSATITCLVKRKGNIWFNSYYVGVSSSGNCTAVTYFKNLSENLTTATS